MVSFQFLNIDADTTLSKSRENVRDAIIIWNLGCTQKLVLMLINDGNFYFDEIFRL